MFATWMEGVDGWINGINGWMDGWIDGRVEGWTDGWRNSWLGQKSYTAKAPNQLPGRVTWIVEPEGRRAETCFPPRSHNLLSVSSAIMMRLLIWVTFFFTLELKKERFIHISLRFLVSPILLGFMDYNVNLNCFYPWAILALKYILWRNYCIPTLLENLLDLV